MLPFCFGPDHPTDGVTILEQGMGNPSATETRYTGQKDQWLSIVWYSRHLICVSIVSNSNGIGLCVEKAEASSSYGAYKHTVTELYCPN